MANSISSTNGAGTANPTPQEINKFLIPLSFLERISIVVKGIFFSRESFKDLCGIKYRIKPDCINCENLASQALIVINAKRMQIRRSDFEPYATNFKVDEGIMKARGLLKLPNKTRSF